MNLWRRIKRWFYDPPFYGIIGAVQVTWDEDGRVTESKMLPQKLEPIYPGHDRRVWRRLKRGG